MSGVTFPICPKLAAKAYRLQKTGLKGKATAEKLGKGIATEQANMLAGVGRADALDAASQFTQNEIKVLVGLLKLERDRRRMGEVSSPKAWMLCRGTGLSEGQIRRATKRINTAFGASDRRASWGLLHHSVNGHIWLEAAGIAVASALAPLDAARVAL
jgi:hypothetical protein